MPPLAEQYLHPDADLDRLNDSTLSSATVIDSFESLVENPESIGEMGWLAKTLKPPW